MPKVRQVTVLSRPLRTIAFGACGLALAAGPLVGGAARAGTVWHVEGGLSSCDDTGEGTLSEPLCTISAGAQRAGAGDTVEVGPALYREQVTLSVPGVEGPAVYRATGPGAVILGTTNLSDAAGWSATATTAWSRPYAPDGPPAQVFLDGARLLPAPGPAQTTPGSFYYDAVAKVLYVDVGGGNPADGHSVEAGGRPYGFFVEGRSGTIIDGFELRGQDNTGIRILNSSGVRVRNVTVSYAGEYGLHYGGAAFGTVEDSDISFAATHGIRLLRSTAVQVLGNAVHHNGFHGIALQESNANTVAHNRVFANVRPEVRSATGISVKDDSDDNLLFGNRVYQNDDSGMQIYTGSDGNLVAHNLSWANGDHGFDTNGSVGTRYVSNTAVLNRSRGFSVQGTATDTLLANNVGVDNGLTTASYDLYVDASSVAGFQSDYDLLWNSEPVNVVRFDDTRYMRIEDYALATGQEAHGLGTDPLFVDAAQGDFHLKSGSPAIDSADAGAPGFVASDPDGMAPFDVQPVPDSGAGSPPFADRGMFEFAACDLAIGGGPVPGLTSGLTFTESSRFGWSPATNAVSHNTYRGTIDGPMATRALVFDHTCLESGDAQGNGILVTEDEEIPPPGAAFYYLTSGGGCGEEGPLDSDAAHPIPNPAPCADVP